MNDGESSVAWFKLAEFIARGERERAMPFLRLLLHSICLAPVRCELEADVLKAFDDKRSTEFYTQAALFYAKEGRGADINAILRKISESGWTEMSELTKVKQKEYLETFGAAALGLLVERLYGAMPG